jgi:hypothetical protein
MGLEEAVEGAISLSTPSRVARHGWVQNTSGGKKNRIITQTIGFALISITSRVNCDHYADL